MSYITGSVDTRAADKLLRELELQGKEGKKAIKHSSQLALEVISRETSEQAAEIDFKPGPGWRKAMSKPSAFVYKQRRNRAGQFWFYSAINYKKPILRLSHLIEKGFNHWKAGFVAGHWFRREAFQKDQLEALKTFKRGMQYGMSLIAKGKKVPNMKQYRNGAEL